MSGYHIEWHNSAKSLAKNKEVIKNERSVDHLAINEIETIPVQIDNEF